MPLTKEFRETIECMNDADGWRWYRVAGNNYASVTGVMAWFVHPKFKAWMINNSPKKIENVSATTAAMGSEIHDKAHAGTEDRLTKLLQDNKMEILEQEFPVYSKHGWAGRCDLKIKYNDKIYLVDIKSGRFGHVGMQLGGYTLAENEHGANVEGIGVISLPRDLERPAAFFDYSAHFDNCLYAWCTCFDTWKFGMFADKALRVKIENEPWAQTKTVLQYDWR